jgi:DNA (cytosine-5)-methyltransferase 1
MTITIGSLFSGIGGFELGLERAIPQARTIWQVEQDTFCQSILRRHWPDATLHSDINQVGLHNLAEVDILCGGFPCQDISIAGKQEGINGKKSSLWWQMHRLIGDLRPRVIVLENVAAIVSNGLSTVSESLAKLGYDLEWQIVSARQFGAPHIRKRWFGVAYSNSHRLWLKQHNQAKQQEKEAQSAVNGQTESVGLCGATNTNSQRSQEQSNKPKPMEKGAESQCGSSQAGWIHSENYWHQDPPKPTLCELDDGISNRVARLKALGNAIVPQCSEYIGHRIRLSGLLEAL